MKERIYVVWHINNGKHYNKTYKEAEWNGCAY